MQLGYNDFNNLVLPGHWWLQNLILRHIYKKKFSLFLSRFCPRLQILSKLLIWFIFFFKNAIRVSKKQNLMGISNPLKKLLKTHVKWQKNGDFDFYYCVQWFSSYNVAFYGWTFLHFFLTDSNSAPNFALYDTHIEFSLILVLLANFNFIRGQTNSKKWKKYF
jgi:hypothetical protein